MDEKTRKNLEETMNILYERADVCPSDSEDYYKLLDRAERIGKVLNEQEKVDSQNMLEKKKYEDSKMWWKDGKFWAATLVPTLTALLLRSYDRHTMMMQTKVICEFEKNNTFTSYAGKGLAGTLRLPQIVDKRG